MLCNRRHHSRGDFLRFIFLGANRRGRADRGARVTLAASVQRGTGAVVVWFVGSRIEELVYIPPGDPKIVPTSAMRQTYTVVDTCFTKRITPMGIYVLLASPENVEKVGADNFRATYGQLVPKYRPGCDPDVQQIDLGRPPF